MCRFSSRTYTHSLRYKAVVRPIMTYGAETTAATTKTKQLLRTTEMNTARAILGKTRFDRMKNIDIIERCNLQEVVKFVKSRRKAWNEHVSRAEQRLIKPNDHQDDHQNDGRTAGGRRLQEHPKLYGREEEEEEDDDIYACFFIPYLLQLSASYQFTAQCHLQYRLDHRRLNPRIIFMYSL